MSDDLELKRFGKYLILDHLVDGGMAKICRARYLSEQADKVVAIKMVQPQFSKDENFKRMFMDEIKVCFGLIHPNIAQTYDYGIIDDQLFTALEYCDGANLKQFLDRLKERNFVFPVEISCYIISQVCQGLSYAHNFTNSLTGEKANIVHRDISPHNVMITYDGAVKVIDFGIAKAESNSDATQAGTIKGKLSYLAPEYLEGEKLDHRYDQFAVGITLWELLCSRKLFQAENDLAVLKKIQACSIPVPSSINPNVPKELDVIVQKALSKDRNLRFENMDQFNRALVKFLYANYPDFNASDLSYFAKELFKEEISADRKKMIEFGKIDISQHLEEMTKSGVKVQTQAEKDVEETKKNVVQELDLSIDENATGSIKLEGTGAFRKEKTNTNVRVKAKTTQGQVKRAPGGGTRKIKAPSPEKLKASTLADESSSSGVVSTIVKVASVAGFAFLVYTNQGLVEKYTGVNLAKYIPAAMRSPASSSSIEDVETQEGVFSMIGFDPFMELFIDGKKTRYETLGISLEVGKTYKIAIRKDGHRSYSTEVSLSAEEPNFTLKVPELEQYTYGELESSLNYPKGATITFEVDGQSIQKNLPVSGYRMPAGEYDAIIKDPVLNTKRRVHFKIIENQRNMLPR